MVDKKKNIDPSDKTLNTCAASTYALPNNKVISKFGNKIINKNPREKNNGNAMAFVEKAFAFSTLSNDEYLVAKTEVKFPPS